MFWPVETQPSGRDEVVGFLLKSTVSFARKSQEWGGGLMRLSCRIPLLYQESPKKFIRPVVCHVRVPYFIFLSHFWPPWKGPGSCNCSLLCLILVIRKEGLNIVKAMLRFSV